MKRIFALLTFLAFVGVQVAQGQYVPNTYYVAKKTTLDAAAESITIQQPASAAKSLKVLSVWIQSTVSCIMTVRRNGAPPSGTALAVVQSDDHIPSATATAYYDSNVGDGTWIMDYTVGAGGTGLRVNFEQFWIRGVDESVAFLRSDTTLTSIAVATNVATATTADDHGLSAGDTVAVQDATVDVDLNGTYTIASTPTGTTLTFATADVADATYNEATLKLKSDDGRNFTFATNAITGDVRMLAVYQEY